ncbi:piggyBac transposable element-derived protein 4-like [Orbicella faveolata]|uniref:piggyBac transposable element-derived protein 4-like n=1 Tax=Orbicella faveolata TaxID=48498 RepID=UPI0009E59575|nr:piggyBac transposable element-derived protein 4-like [Orbicella faveolata]XP_020603909.1 piggyBac transposable element-derived protein 4-like [Orbicella faveolata]
MAGSQSLVSSTNSVSVTTSATTTTAASGLAVTIVSPSVSVPVATPAQEPVAGPSHTYNPGTFYSTRQRTYVPAKRARVEPTPQTTSKGSCGKGSNKKGKKGKEPVASAAPSEQHFLSYDDPDVGNPLPGFTPPPFTPSREPGVHLEGPNLRNKMVKALDFFKLYFTDELVGDIVQHTNTYAYIQLGDENSQHRSYGESDGSWRDTTPEEMLRFIALLIYFGLVRVVGDSTKYWSTATLYHGLWARSILSRKRFRALMALLHVVDPCNEPAGNKLHEVQGFVDFMKGRCKLLYQPRQHVAIDERMVKSRHRSGIRQYIKDKPIKYGIKFWVLADSSTAYVVDFNIYSGKAAGREISAHGLGYDVVRKLMGDYENQGYHLYVDNFYSSMTLAKHLFQQGILFTGTILENRKDFPPSLKNGKQWAKGQPRGAMRWERDPPVLAMQWVDNRVVSMICTASNANDKVQVKRKKREGGAWQINNEVQQPLAFQAYNRYMNAVDRSDQILATHNVQRKCLKWWKAIFFHLIDLAVVNSFILFLEQQRRFPDYEQLQRPPKYNLQSFREELIRNICDLPPSDQPPAQTRVHPQPPQGRFDVEHSPIFLDEKKDCVVCAKREKVRKRVYTSCSAPQCRGKHMHFTKDNNCWQIFHSREFHDTQ